jgi:hypothetical protein
MVNYRLVFRILGLVLLVIGFSGAQVVSPNQIKDAHLRALQVQYNRELIELGKLLSHAS